MLVFCANSLFKIYYGITDYRKTVSNFRKTVISLTSFYGVLGLALVIGGPSSHAQATVCSKIIVTGHPNYPPYQWREGNSIVGASTDITRQILDEMGIPSEFSYVGPWRRVLHSARHGQVDLIMSLKNTPERRQFLDFTDSPFFLNPMALFVRVGSDVQFDSWDDLKTYQGGKNAGDRYGKKFDEFAERHLSLGVAQSLDSNFKKLLAGRIDYLITGRYPGQAYIATTEFHEKVVPLPKNVNKGYIHHGFSTKSPCRKLIPRFNKRLLELIEDGTTEKAMQANIMEWRKYQARHQDQ